MINISKKGYLFILSLLIFVSGSFGQGSFLSVKKAFGYGTSGNRIPAKTVPVQTPAISSQTSIVSPVSQVGASQVLGVATFKFNRYLTKGSQGDDVIELQKRLAQEGVFSGPITGYFGNLTAAAVRMFQSKNSIEPLGVVGPMTRIALSKNLPAAPEAPLAETAKPLFKFTRSLSYGLAGDDVRALQERLLAEGVYDNPITGYFGALTLKSVKKLQAKYNLAQVGIVGPLTRELLNKND